MRITVPLTGEIIEYDPKHPEFASGKDSNRVRPINFRKLLPENLAYEFSWVMISFNPEAGTAELEVEFPPRAETRRIATEEALDKLFRENTADKLYQLTGEPRLIKPLELNE